MVRGPKIELKRFVLEGQEYLNISGRKKNCSLQSYKHIYVTVLSPSNNIQYGVNSYSMLQISSIHAIEKEREMVWSHYSSGLTGCFTQIQTHRGTAAILYSCTGFQELVRYRFKIKHVNLHIRDTISTSQSYHDDSLLAARKRLSFLQRSRAKMCEEQPLKIAYIPPSSRLSSVCCVCVCDSAF